MTVQVALTVMVWPLLAVNATVAWPLLSAAFSEMVTVTERSAAILPDNGVTVTFGLELFELHDSAAPLADNVTAALPEVRSTRGGVTPKVPAGGRLLDGGWLEDDGG